MKNYTKILAFIALLFLLTAEDCGPGLTEAEQSETFENQLFIELENRFVADELAAENLVALEQRAVQKFNELNDFMKICSDSSLNVQFRKQARQMITESFVSEKEVQRFFRSLQLLEDLDRYLLYYSNGEPVRTALKLHGLDKPFAYSATEYKTQLKYHFHDTDKFLGVRATKNIKAFGDERLFVWELFFEPNEVK